MTTDMRLLCYGLFTPGALHTITITIYCTCTCYIVPIGVILYYFEVYLCINIIDIIMSLHYTMINAIINLPCAVKLNIFYITMNKLLK